MIQHKRLLLSVEVIFNPLYKPDPCFLHTFSPSQSSHLAPSLAQTGIYQTQGEVHSDSMLYSLNSTTSSKCSAKSIPLRTLPASVSPICLVFPPPQFYHTSHPCQVSPPPAQHLVSGIIPRQQPQTSVNDPVACKFLRYGVQKLERLPHLYLTISFIELPIKCQMKGDNEHLFPFLPREHPLLCESYAKQGLVSDWRETGRHSLSVVVCIFAHQFCLIL